MDYLPDVNFHHTTRARQYRNRPTWSPLNDQYDIEYYNPNNLGPRTIIRDAFVKYIENTVIENNEIAIQIIYKEDLDGDVKSLFIIKKKFRNQEERREIDRENDIYVGSRRQYFNNEIDNVLSELENFYVLEVNLCEIYDIIATIPIKVLYTNENPTETLGGGEVTLPVTESPFFRGFEQGDTCGICADDLANGEPICVNKNCQHGFHCHCINNWFNGPAHPPQKCPACRQNWTNVVLSDAQQQIIQNMSFGKRKCKKCKSKKKCPSCAMRVLQAQLKMAKEFAMNRVPFQGASEPVVSLLQPTPLVPKPPPLPPPKLITPKKERAVYMDELKQKLKARGEVGFGKKLQSEIKYLLSIK
jgi:hypothetical protein